MRNRVYLPLFLFIPLVSTVSLGQSIARSAIVPAGGSASLEGERATISWTVGEPNVRRYQAGGINLTQGFQQPYVSFASLRAENFAGKPGETKEMRIFMDQFRGLSALNASAIRVKIRFNATLLEPVSSVPDAIIHRDSIANGKRTLELELPVNTTASPAQLAAIRFTVGLGNDSVSAIELLDAVPVDGPFMLRSVPGQFSLLGICYEGGPRLVEPIDRSTLLLRPNPAFSSTELSFDVHREGKVRVVVADLFGRVHRVVVDESLAEGHYALGFDVSMLPSGSYSVVLETASGRMSYPLVVQH